MQGFFVIPSLQLACERMFTYTIRKQYLVSHQLLGLTEILYG